jgi:hypothetical protein
MHNENTPNRSNTNLNISYLPSEASDFDAFDGMRVGSSSGATRYHPKTPGGSDSGGQVPLSIFRSLS